MFSAPIWQVDYSSALVIIARHYRHNVREKQQDFEALLLLESSPYLSLSSDAFFSMSLEDGIHVVGQRVGELIVFACGTDELDEITLSSLVLCIRNVVHSLVKPESLGNDLQVAEGEKPVIAQSMLLSDREVLAPAVYGMFAVSIDEIVTGGVFDITDSENIMKGAKLKI